MKSERSLSLHKKYQGVIHFLYTLRCKEHGFIHVIAHNTHLDIIVTLHCQKLLKFLKSVTFYLLVKPPKSQSFFQLKKAL